LLGHTIKINFGERLKVRKKIQNQLNDGSTFCSFFFENGMVLVNYYYCLFRFNLFVNFDTNVFFIYLNFKLLYNNNNVGSILWQFQNENSLSDKVNDDENKKNEDETKYFFLLSLSLSF